MKPKLLIVGSGITGAYLGRCLRSELKDIDITLWEKNERAGGRFYTIKYDDGFAIDMGAQYITTTKEIMESFDSIYSELLSKKYIQPMKCNMKGVRNYGSEYINYSATNGMESIVDYIIKEAGLSVMYKNELKILNIDGNKWVAYSSSGQNESFDIVVLTIPPPDILEIEGDVNSVLTLAQKKDLSLVKYSSRFALGLFFGQDVETEYDSEYIDNNVLRYVAFDKWKSKQITFRSAVIHTSVKFNESTIEDGTSVERYIRENAKTLFPHWPEPTYTQLHSWRHSQVTNPFTLKPAGIIMNAQPLLVAGGDGFIGSTFDQCISSAKVLCNVIVNKYKITSKE